jgi:hypothetical protein
VTVLETMSRTAQAGYSGIGTTTSGHNQVLEQKLRLKSAAPISVDGVGAGPSLRHDTQR